MALQLSRYHIVLVSDEPTTLRPCPPPPFVLALGDSLTASHRLPRAASFASRLEALLRADHPGALVHNAGVSGNTTGDALRRLPALLSSLDRRPDVALVELGANDLIRAVPPGTTRANLAAIIEELQRSAIPVLLATLEPPPLLAGLGTAYATIYAELAARYGVPTHSFFPPGILGHRDFVLSDRLHPNAAAVELAARNILPAIIALLES